MNLCDRLIDWLIALSRINMTIFRAHLNEIWSTKSHEFRVPFRCGIGLVCSAPGPCPGTRAPCCACSMMSISSSAGPATPPSASGTLPAAKWSTPWCTTARPCSTSASRTAWWSPVPRYAAKPSFSAYVSGLNHSFSHFTSGRLHLLFEHVLSFFQDRSIAVWDMLSPRDINLRRVLVGHRAAVNVVDFRREIHRLRIRWSNHQSKFLKNDNTSDQIFSKNETNLLPTDISKRKSWIIWHGAQSDPLVFTLSFHISTEWPGTNWTIPFIKSFAFTSVDIPRQIISPKKNGKKIWRKMWMKNLAEWSRLKNLAE